MEVGEAHYTSEQYIVLTAYRLLRVCLHISFFDTLLLDSAIRSVMKHRRLAKNADHQFDAHEDSELLLSDLSLKAVEKDGKHLLQKDWELKFDGSLAHDNDDCEV